MAAQKPSSIGGTNRLAAIFVTVAFVFCPEAIGGEVINLVGIFSAPVFRPSSVGRNSDVRT
jgi:hypothetical protein